MNDHPRRLKRADFAFRWERAMYPVALAIGLLSGYCDARGSTLGVHLYSPHFDKDESAPQGLQFNDVTTGLYWRGDSGLTLGVVRNSLARTSVYAAYTVETGDKRFALTIGAMTGYQYRREHGAQFCPKGSKPFFPGMCSAQVGKTSAVLRPLIAPSVALPAIGGVTPRVALLGKAISFSLEVPL